MLSIEFKDYKSIVEANYLLSIYIINIVFAIFLSFICSLVYFLYKKTKTKRTGIGKSEGSTQMTYDTRNRKTVEQDISGTDTFTTRFNYDTTGNQDVLSIHI